MKQYLKELLCNLGFALGVTVVVFGVLYGLTLLIL